MLTAHRSIPVDYTHEVTCNGVTLVVDMELRVTIDAKGAYGSSELLDWTIEQIASRQYGSRHTSSYVALPERNPWVMLLRADLEQSEKFARAVQDAVADEMEMVR